MNEQSRPDLEDQIKVQLQMLDLEKPGLLVVQLDREMTDAEHEMLSRVFDDYKITRPALAIAPGMSIDIIPDEHMEALGWVRKPTIIS